MKLSVMELLQHIKDNKMRMEDEICFEMYAGCCGDVEEMEFDDIEAYELQNNQKILKISLGSLNGYFSCRQVSHTKKEHESWFKKD